MLPLVQRVFRLPRLRRAALHGLHFLFTRMSFALPAQRLRETGTLLAFHHPQPAYPVHILLVPRREIPSLAELDPLLDAPFLADLFAAVQSLVAELHLEQAGYRLIVNGGKFQDFPYLHFHLISEQAVEITSYPTEDRIMHGLCNIAIMSLGGLCRSNPSCATLRLLHSQSALATKKLAPVSSRMKSAQRCGVTRSDISAY
jgi:histidine triad (HIT) family protein